MFQIVEEEGDAVSNDCPFTLSLKSANATLWKNCLTASNDLVASVVWI